MRVRVYSTGIAQNELTSVDMPTWCILQVYSVHTHTHARARTFSVIPFEDREPTGINVDNA